MAYHINNTIDGAALYEHFVHWDCAQTFQCVDGPLMCWRTREIALLIDNPDGPSQALPLKAHLH